MEHPKSVEIIPLEGPRDLATVTAKATGVVLVRAEGLGTVLGVLYGQHPQQEHPARLP
jgi:hypothetical protein